MPASYEVEEAWDSRDGARGESASELLIFDVYGLPGGGDDPNENGARAAALAVAPAKMGGLFLQNVRHKPRGGFRWLIEIDYGRRPRDPEKLGIEIDVGTTTVKRLVSIATVGSFKRDGDSRDIPDFHGAIGVSKDRVEGADVPIAEAKVALRKWFPPSQLTFEFWNTIFQLTGKFNTDSFLGLDAGQWLFDGANCSYIYELDTDPEEQELFEVPFRFKFSPNVEGFDVHGIEIDKRGWDAFWNYCEDDEDEDAKVLIVKPRAVIVEQTIPGASFAPLVALGLTLPTPPGP